MWDVLTMDFRDSTPQRPQCFGSSSDDSFVLLRHSSNYLPFIMCSNSVTEDKEVSLAVAV